MKSTECLESERRKAYNKVFNVQELQPIKTQPVGHLMISAELCVRQSIAYTSQNFYPK